MKRIQVLAVFSLLVLIVLGGLFYATPLQRIYRQYTGEMKEARLEQAFQRDRLEIINHEIEIRFSTKLVTVKSIIEYEAGVDLPDFQPFILYNDFTFDSIKQNGREIRFEKWFTCGAVTFWKVYLLPGAEEKKESLCLLYAGKVPRESDICFFPPELFWYARTPGMLREEKLSLFKCIVDQDWVPVFPGVLDSVAIVRDGVKSFEFVVPQPVSAAMLLVGKTREPRVREKNGYTYNFFHTEISEELFTLLGDRAVETTSYFLDLFGDLPLREHSFFFNKITHKHLRTPGDASIYYTVLNLDRPPFPRNRDRVYRPEDEIQLVDKIARIWLGGAVLPSWEKGGFLVIGLARYAAYLALDELYSPEQAKKFLDECYCNYSAGERYGLHEKALAEIFPCLDRQKALVTYKAPLVWHAFRYHLGEEAFFELLRRFYREYSGRVGTLEGFRELATGISDLELDWFFDYFLYSSARLDLKVQQVTTVQAEDGYISGVRIGPQADSGPEFRGRVLLRVETAEEIKETIVWPSGAVEEIIMVETTALPLAVILDPGEWWPDVNRANNEWCPEADW